MNDSVEYKYNITRAGGRDSCVHTNIRTYMFVRLNVHAPPPDQTKTDRDLMIFGTDNSLDHI